MRMVGRRRVLGVLLGGVTAGLAAACAAPELGGPGIRTLRRYVVGDWALILADGKEGTLTVDEDGTWREDLSGRTGTWALGATGATVGLDPRDGEPAAAPVRVSGVPERARAALSRTYTVREGWAGRYGGPVVFGVEGDTVTVRFPAGGSRAADETVSLTKVSGAPRDGF
ncbi:hypothetical protein ACN20G_32190 (plasmid) [Streptomyces sp. BI20]|uniref:hypothetical protein n=1 Tax=Streptomyces sp. BI20 TaxID=3403460 RepID=UPI003C72A80C